MSPHGKFGMLGVLEENESEVEEDCEVDEAFVMAAVATFEAKEARLSPPVFIANAELEAGAILALS